MSRTSQKPGERRVEVRVSRDRAGSSVRPPAHFGACCLRQRGERGGAADSTSGARGNSGGHARGDGGASGRLADDDYQPRPDTRTRSPRSPFPRGRCETARRAARSPTTGPRMTPSRSSSSSGSRVKTWSSNRPLRFTREVLPVDPGVAECFAGSGGTVPFTDRGRQFGAYILLGPDAPASLADQARAVLQTLRVDPAS